jgi:hypothetical protein
LALAGVEVSPVDEDADDCAPAQATSVEKAQAHESAYSVRARKKCRMAE